MLTAGLLINPLAGIGGSVALKGSDGADVQARARERGGAGRGEARARRALEAAGEAARRVRWLTWGGAMGEDVCRSLGLPAQRLGTAGRLDTRASDTITAVRVMADAGADLIVLCGGDGTARDVFEALGQRLPVLGIPAGVKMHSGIFATTPENAGAVLRRLVEGGLVQAGLADVRDLDEAALRAGEVRARFYGELPVPELGGFLQHTKEGGRENEALALEEIVAEVVERLQALPGPCLLGPGSTLAAIKRGLGLDATLIGVDVLVDARQVGKDVDAAWLGSCLDRYRAAPALVLSFTRRQGFLLGRGNQQFTPALLRRIGRDRLWVAGTRSKLLSLEGRPLLIDSDDPALDADWSGLVEVITGYRDSLWYRLDHQG